MPRLPIPSDTEAFADETRAAVRHIKATRTSNPPPSLYLTYAGPAGGRLSDLVEHLRYHTSLTGAESELAICTAARAANAGYIWNAHVKLGLKAGTPMTEIPVDTVFIHLDEHTAQLIPEAATNVWRLRLSADGSALTVHCANPGSMSTCSTPGNRVRIRDAGNPKRKLSHDLEQIRSGRAWVCVNTAVPNRVVGAALRANRIAELSGYDSVRAEANDGAGSRFDFLLESDSSRCWVEVKNVTLRKGREARFPDAVTARGLKHLDALRDLRARGDRAVMLYFVGRADVDVFRPAREVDPAYAEGLQRAVRGGVEVLPIRAVVTPRGVGVGPVLPYHLGHA